jgi:ABC-2 type transport system permease protein
VVCYAFALLLGLPITVNIIYALLFIIPISVLFVALGLLFGSILNDKQVGGVCGALLTNLCAWLSGVWFDLELVGGAFGKIANALPFVHAVEFEKALFSGNFEAAGAHILPIIIYSVIASAAAVLCFIGQMKKQ